MVQRQNTLTSMHRRLLSLTRDTRLSLVLTILAGFLGGLFTIWQARLFSRSVDAVFLDGQGLAQVGGVLRLMLVAVILRAVSAWLTELSASAVARHVKANLRQRLFAHILSLGPAYTRGERTGELTAAAVDGVEALDAYFSQYLPQLVISALVPLSVLVFVFPLDPLSGLVLLFTAPLIPVFMILIGKTAESLTKRQWETLSRLSAHFLDSLQGLTTLKLFGQSKAQVRSIAEVSEKFRDVTLSVLRVTFISALALELLATLSTAVIAVEVGLRLLYFRLSFEQALFLLVIAPEFYLPLRMLGLRFHAGMAGTSAARRLFEILDEPATSKSVISDQPPVTSEQPVLDLSADNEQTANADYASRTTYYALRTTNLSFTYPNSTTPALDNISITIPAGKHTALVGPSGAGKSTLVNILLGFLQPSSGQITRHTSGDAKKLHPSSFILHPFIAWVPQHPYLFHDTLAANIRLGKPEASDEEVTGAAQAAGLDDFILSLPDGYQTVIGEGGARLSGGQAQRLALARAFLMDAPIIILDEPTSSLDPQTEAMLEESTRRLRQGRTVITIAHRLNTIYRADQIIVLDQGRVAETGSHTELLARDGLYVQLIEAHAPAGLKNQTATPTTPEQQEKYAQSLVSASLGTVERPSLNARRSKSDIQSPWAIVVRLFSFLRGSWGQVTLSVLLGALTILASLSLLGSSAWLISAAALHPSIAELQVAIVGVRFFGISRGVFRYLERLTSHGVTFRLLACLRTWFYEKLEPLAPARLMDYRAGDLLSRIVSDVETLENFYVRAVAPPLSAVLVSAAACLYLGSFHPLLGLALLGLLLSLGLVLPLFTRMLSQRPGQELILRRAALHTQLVDGIQGLADLLAYGRGPNRLEQLRVTGETYARSQSRLAQVNALQTGLGIFITNFGMWAVLTLSIPLVASGDVDGIILATLALIALASFEAVQPLPLAAQMLSSSLEAARRLFEIVGQPVARLENKGTEKTDVSSYGLKAISLSFAYPGSTIPALEDISFELPEGGSLAIVGPSGAGKSTLVNLLMRFWDTQQGDILLGKNPIGDYEQDVSRSQFAVLSQNAYFFNATVRQNLQLARPKANQDVIEQAARLAHIHEFITSLPKGYETVIGEQGLRLSGGERQRLGLARALLKGSRLLVLDEPAANLDALTERQVLESIFEVMSSRSVLLITHRLIGLERFDQVLVMEAGRIIERGTHAELLASGGLYRRLFELQNRIISQQVKR